MISQLAKVEWQIGVYKGVKYVNCFADASDADILTRAENAVSRENPSMPAPAYRSFKVVERENING